MYGCQGLETGKPLNPIQTGLYFASCDPGETSVYNFKTAHPTATKITHMQKKRIRVLK